MWHKYCLPGFSWLKLIVSALFVLSVYISFCTWYLDYHFGRGTTFDSIRCDSQLIVNQTIYWNWTASTCEDLLRARNDLEWAKNPVTV
jgi:hypothetical protein